MSSVKKCFTYVQVVQWSASAQISNAYLCQPNAASSNYTVSWDATDFEQITLGKKSLFAAVYFPFELKYHICIKNFCGMFISIFAIIFLPDIVCLKMCDPSGLPLQQSHSSRRSTTYKHLPSDLSRYCHFGETLLTPSRVVDTSMIYLRYLHL